MVPAVPVQRGLGPFVRKGLRLLIVDDHALFRVGMRQILEQEADMEVVGEAIDGRSAEDAAQALLPDVILLDIEMPRMDGFDLVRNIRGDERTKDLPVIMITSRIAQKHRDYAAELGVNHYLGKPYDEEQLLSLIAHFTKAAAAAAGRA